MSTWQEVCAIASRFGARQLNDTAWLFELPGAGEGRVQKVFVFYELLLPDFEFVQVKSAFAPIREVDVDRVIRSLGQLQVGAIGYTPFRADDGSELDGMLYITTSIPLRSFDLSDPTTFLMYLHILARAADDIGGKVASAGSAGTGNGQAPRPPRMSGAPSAAAAPAAYRAVPGQATQVQDDEEWVRHLAGEYGRACIAVMAALEGALKVANEAKGARKMADTRPQHEISIHNFTRFAEQSEKEFGSLYQEFENARGHAKDIGTKLIDACQQQDPELCLGLTLDPETYSVAGAAIEFMRAVSGPTPAAFIEGIGQGNAAVNSSPDYGEPGFGGYIYHDAVRDKLNQL
jgi:hypothetical protein